MEAMTQNNTKATRTPTPTPILVTMGQELTFVAMVVSPSVGETEVMDEDEGLVSVGPPVSVVIALFGLLVGAGAAVASPT